MQFIAFAHEQDGIIGISFPDLPGCVSAGETLDEALAGAQEALALHVQGMQSDGDTVPVPRSIGQIEADATLADWRAGATLAVVPLVIDRGSPKRVNISLDPGLLEAIDDEAAARGMTRSALLASAARNEIRGRWETDRSHGSSASRSAAATARSGSQRSLDSRGSRTGIAEGKAKRAN